MLSQYRSVVVGIFEPPARLLLRLGISPDVVTLIGTAGVSAAALWFLPRGDFVAGVLMILVFVFSDTLDGTMARLSGRTSAWGAFLDSTLDRVSDAAILAAVALYYSRQGDTAFVGVTLLCLVGGLLVSYTRARAEGLGMTAAVGIAERTERLAIVLIGLFVAGFGLPAVLDGALIVLAVLTWITVVQRMLHVRRQALP